MSFSFYKKQLAKKEEKISEDLAKKELEPDVITSINKKTKKQEGYVMIGYCVKCKAKTEMKEANIVKMKNGRPACKGSCSVCNTGMYKILSKADAEKAGL